VVVSGGSVGGSGTIVEEEAATTATPSCSGINFVFEQFTLEFILSRCLMCSFITINNNNKSRLVKWSRNANNGSNTNKTNILAASSSSSNNNNSSNEDVEGGSGNERYYYDVAVVEKKAVERKQFTPLPSTSTSITAAPLNQPRRLIVAISIGSKRTKPTFTSSHKTTSAASPIHQCRQHQHQPGNGREGGFSPLMRSIQQQSQQH
jgi:hypothetical protein